MVSTSFVGVVAGFVIRVLYIFALWVDRRANGPCGLSSLTTVVYGCLLSALDASLTEKDYQATYNVSCSIWTVSLDRVIFLIRT